MVTVFLLQNMNTYLPYHPDYKAAIEISKVTGRSGSLCISKVYHLETNLIQRNVDFHLNSRLRLQAK